MIKYIGVGLVSALLSACATVVVLYLVLVGDHSETIATPTSLIINEDGIGKIELETLGQNFALKVSLTKSMTCSQIIETLGIKSLPIEEKTFSPTCIRINDSLVKITYIETISA